MQKVAEIGLQGFETLSEWSYNISVNTKDKGKILDAELHQQHNHNICTSVGPKRLNAISLRSEEGRYEARQNYPSCAHSDNFAIGKKLCRR